MGASRIVVGFDGSSSGRTALEWARREARLRGATLEVVHVYEPPPSAMITKIPDPHLLAHVEASVHAQAADLLEEALEPLDDVEVEPYLVRGPDPAAALTRRAMSADLLVVGSRGRGGFAGLLLGSVSQKCVHHAPCPVVVVRGSAARAEDGDEERGGEAVAVDALERHDGPSGAGLREVTRTA